jgi:SAM-dependent methyltransferase
LTGQAIARRYPRVEAVRAELTRLPFPDGAFDLVVCLQVVEHVWDPAGCLASLRRVLAAGGELVLSTPNRLTFSPGGSPTNPFHAREFSADELRQEAEAAGFSVTGLLGVHHAQLHRATSALYARGRPGGEAALAARLAEQPPEDWPRGLRRLVSRVRPRWFTARRDRLADSLDLVLLGSRQ